MRLYNWFKETKMEMGYWIRGAVLGGLVFALAAAGGCFPTANNTRSDINRVSVKKLEDALVEPPKPETKEKTRNRTLSAEEARAVVAEVGIPPAQNLNIYFMPKPGAVERREMNTTGMINGALDEIKDLEAALPMDSDRISIILGAPDYKKKVATRGAANQASNTCGIVGVDRYTVKGKKIKGVRVAIEEQTGLKGTREESRYKTYISFETDDSVSVSKKRADWVMGAEAAEGALIACLFTGPWGAAGSGLWSLTDAGWSLAEGKEAPRGSRVYDNRENVVPGRGAECANVLRKAKDLGARAIAVAYCEDGVSVTYLTDSTLVGRDNNGVFVYTTKEQGDHLYKLLYNLAHGFTTAGADGIALQGCNEKTHTHIISGGGSGGGRTGGPGGGGGGAGGGSSGGPGGG
jgi:hypothetical protein